MAALSVGQVKSPDDQPRWAVIGPDGFLARGSRFKTKAEADSLLRYITSLEKRRARQTQGNGKQIRGWSRQDGFGS